ncbi:hypothetical protein [Lacimicrobium alkaliphilum]|uniref:Uncharacterized protein n=1 Tax=Lacimicrobium alkaliphilum TaxID=1526571 RepID=A0ABQ1RDU7_9ALTE|nr:hypothetical protein [Lacimicrobium alkaliphilum]GGD63884.1 hypothetical protein GCM10011357_19060 [Lacimicrobium alkaliphilum]
MIDSIQFSNRSITLLNRRQLSQDEIQQFGTLLDQAKAQSGSAKQRLLALSPEQLALLQKANSLADPINPRGLSEEGAANLLSQPDHSDKVDLNNDGIVEVGLARSIIFPPVNAPEHVKAAWDKATEGMGEMEKALQGFHMHLTIYGIQVEGMPQKPVLPPEQQWGQQGVAQFFGLLRGNLEFRVSREGWTEQNRELKGLYDRFEDQLSSASGNPTQIAATQGQSPGQAANQEQAKQSTATTDKTYEDIMQLLIDARMGIDREKLNEIEERIQTVSNDDSLSSEQKKQLISMLEKQKEALLEEAQRNTVENEKRKALLSANGAMYEQLKENALYQIR